MAVLLVAASTAAADFARLSGFVDGYYAANDNRAPSGHNFFPGTGTTATRANELALNIAALEIVRDPRPLGFHISIVSGDAADVVHAGEPRPRRHPYRNIYQASASLQATPRLLLEGGIYPSHIGFEAFSARTTGTTRAAGSASCRRTTRPASRPRTRGASAGRGSSTW